MDSVDWEERFFKLVAVIEGTMVDDDLVNEWFRLTDRECELLASIKRKKQQSESIDDEQVELEKIQRLLKDIWERINEQAKGRSRTEEWPAKRARTE